MRRGARRNGRAGGLVAPREAARNADGNAWPPLPGRAVADRGTDGTDGGTGGNGGGGSGVWAGTPWALDGTSADVRARNDRWVSGLGVRASQLGAYATFSWGLQLYLNIYYKVWTMLTQDRFEFGTLFETI